jgi:hypothetical protein
MVMNTLLAMISKYAGYFHDGAIREIQHDQNSVKRIEQTCLLLKSKQKKFIGKISQIYLIHTGSP